MQAKNVCCEPSSSVRCAPGKEKPKRKSRKKKPPGKWNKLYFQPRRALEEKKTIGNKGREIKAGHQIYKQLTCFKCNKTFHKRSSLFLHNLEIHPDDLQAVPSRKTKRKLLNKVPESFTSCCTSSEDKEDEGVIKRFEKEEKEDTEDEVVSSDDEFNKEWERKNLPALDVKKNTVQVYSQGDWEWMQDHEMFQPEVVLENSLNISMMKARKIHNVEIVDLLDDSPEESFNDYNNGGVCIDLISDSSDDRSTRTYINKFRHARSDQDNTNSDTDSSKHILRDKRKHNDSSSDNYYFGSDHRSRRNKQPYQDTSSDTDSSKGIYRKKRNEHDSDNDSCITTSI